MSGKQEGRLKGERNTQPQTRPVRGTSPHLRRSGDTRRESNQDLQIAFASPLYLVVGFFFLFQLYNTHILIPLTLTENIATAKSLKYFLVILILPLSGTKVTSRASFK